MTYIKSYKELIVWQKSILLVKEVFQTTALFPKSEMFGITSQMRRAAVSIPSNIAEGSARKTRKDFGQFIAIAYGSALELETQSLISKDLHLANADEFSKMDMLLEEVLKMLNVINTKFSSRI